MSATSLIRTFAALIALSLLVGLSSVSAHEMTIKGTVAAVEPTRVQIKTGEEKQGVSPAWYVLDAKTKILRGKEEVTVAAAKITVGERAVAIVDHDAQGTMKTLELRLAAR